MVTVIVLLGVVLRLEKMIVHIGLEGVQVPEETVHGVGARRTCSVQDLEWLKEAGGVKSLCLVSLTCGTGTHKFTHEAVVMLHHEVLSKSLQCLLNAFMPN